MKQVFILLSLILCITGCTPVKLPVKHQYTLSLCPYKTTHRTPLNVALFISKPEAMAGYQTSQMLYVNSRFSVEPFAKNGWDSPPADMLYPLLVKRFQDSRAFRAITSSPYADKADYRLDTQLIELYQDFLAKQSTQKFTAKITITRVADNKVLASRLIKHQIPCHQNTPYGGVVAANKATSIFIEEALDFVTRQVQNDKGS